MKTLPLVASALLVSLLAACGGGGDDPDPTNYDSAFAISSATNSDLNGAYANANTPLSGVNKLERIGATDACVFSFENIPRVGGGAVAEGAIEYLVDTTQAHRVTMKLAGVTYEASPPVGNSSVSKSGNRVNFAGTVLTSGSNSITLSGFIPMRTDRPAGC